MIKLIFWRYLSINIGLSTPVYIILEKAKELYLSKYSTGMCSCIRGALWYYDYSSKHMNTEIRMFNPIFLPS